jgi:hypothetical protein
MTSSSMTRTATYEISLTPLQLYLLNGYLAGVTTQARQGGKMN